MTDGTEGVQEKTPEEVLSQPVKDAKEEIRGMDHPDLGALLETEREDRNRKTMIGWLEGQIEKEAEEGIREGVPEGEEFEKQRQERIDLAKEFTREILDKYGSWIKAVVVWGSTARGEFTEKSDIDFVILVDDTKEDLDKAVRREMDDWIYRKAKEIDERLGPQPVWTITEFMRMTRKFTPLSYELLKDGIPTYDTGFFLTHKRLLEMGEIKATPEAAQRHWSAVPRKLSRAKNAKLGLIAEDLYYAMIKAEESVMMYMGKDIPHPNHAADYLRKYLVEPGIVEEKYADWLEDVVSFRKAVEHKEIKEIDSEKIDDYMERAEEFVDEMGSLLQELEIQRKRKDISRSYDIMIRASMAALEAVNRRPEDSNDLLQAFREHLVEADLVQPFYEEVLEGVIFMNQKMQAREVEDVSERFIAITSEYVRRFLDEAEALYEDLDMDFEEAMEKMEEIPMIETEVEAPESAVTKSKGFETTAPRKPDRELQRKLEAAGQLGDEDLPDSEEKEELKEHDEMRR